MLKHVQAAEARDAARRWMLATQMALAPHQQQARELLRRALDKEKMP